MNLQRLVLPRDVLVPLPQDLFDYVDNSPLVAHQLLLTVYLMAEVSCEDIRDVFTDILDDVPAEHQDRLVGEMVVCYNNFHMKVSPYLDFLFVEHNAQYLAFAELDNHHGLLVVELELQRGPILH